MSSELESLIAKAKAGNRDAQCELSFRYSNGDGVPLDKAQALHWLRLAADQDAPEAQAAIGLVLRAGDGVQQDKAQAVEWLRRAAKNGSARGQFNLGLSLMLGEGVDIDRVAAFGYIARAAVNGFPGAADVLELCKEGFGSDEAKAALEHASYPTFSLMMGPPAAGQMTELFEDFQVTLRNSSTKDVQPDQHAWMKYEKESAAILFSKLKSTDTRSPMDTAFRDMFGTDVTVETYTIGTAHIGGQWIASINVSQRHVIGKDGWPVMRPINEEAANAIAGMVALMLGREGIRWTFIHQ